MRFTVNKGSTSLIWEDGAVSSPNTRALFSLVTTAAALEGHPVYFPTGPATLTDHLSSPLSALKLMLDQLGEGATARGDVPSLSAVQEGAVA